MGDRRGTVRRSCVPIGKRMPAQKREKEMSAMMNCRFFRLPQTLIVGPGASETVGEEIKKIGKSYNIISRVKPGITGLWQVRGRSLLSFEERLFLDEYYIRNWSLWLDIVILFKTTKALSKGEGAF